MRKGAFDQDELADFLYRESGKFRKGVDFDWRGALSAMVDWFDRRRGPLRLLTHNAENLEKLFCAELVAAALEQAHAVPSINASEVSPIDICRWALYEEDYVQLRGDRSKGIDGYNETELEAWQPNAKKARRRWKARRRTRRPNADVSAPSRANDRLARPRSGEVPLERDSPPA